MNPSGHLDGVLQGTSIEMLAGPLSELVRKSLRMHRHGDLAHWQEAIAGLPEIEVSEFRFDTDAVAAISSRKPEASVLSQLQGCMMALHPWRKGPFELFGMLIDAEWQSCLKWSRIEPHLTPLDGRVVLDVGSGNGYYLFRMLGAGASVAIGVDPTKLFVAQFQALNRYFGTSRAVVLPLRGEDLSGEHDGIRITGFDTVFSMGVYYHRRDPRIHLCELSELLRPGGELVLETLIVKDGDEAALHPTERYARMRNVWCIPSVSLLFRELKEAGFCSPRLVDITVTTSEEQRSTDWMTFESLAECLDPLDQNRTLEGYPAPIRACIIATRKTTN